MKNIELPTYRSIVANEVFGKKAKPLYVPLAGKVAVTQVARLTRFKIPNQEEVVDFIRTSAQEIDSHYLEKDKPSEDDAETIYFLKSLPASEFKEILKGEKDSLHHLRNHFPESDLQEGSIYIEAMSGIVPNQALDAARESLEEKGSEVYERAIERIGVKKWGLRVRLLENGGFPDNLELEYLLDRGVIDSNVFSIRGDFGDYKNVANQVRLLYRALTSPERITQIIDTSYRFLEKRAASTVRETAECFGNRDVLGGLSKIVGKIINDFSGEVLSHPQENPFGFGGRPPSLN